MDAEIAVIRIAIVVVVDLLAKSGDTTSNLVDSILCLLTNSLEAPRPFGWRSMLESVNAFFYCFQGWCLLQKQICS